MVIVPGASLRRNRQRERFTLSRTVIFLRRYRHGEPLRHAWKLYIWAVSAS